MTSSSSSTNLTSYRVIYGDTDKMGVVYYANYLRWFERGRSELLREMGTPYAAIEERGMHFPVAEVSCRYFKSARYDDLILIETRLTSVSRASLTFAYQIRREADATLLASGSTKHACIDNQGRILRIAIDLVKALDNTLER
ncbi:MAG: thioesterase family protein [Candidatus Binatia bacterium]